MVYLIFLIIYDINLLNLKYLIKLLNKNQYFINPAIFNFNNAIIINVLMYQLNNLTFLLKNALTIKILLIRH